MSGVRALLPSQPKTVKGSRPEENQVSSTSVSCLISVMPQPLQAVAISRETVMHPHALQCHAGMRWPHQSWREMHQSRMFSIQLKNVLFQFSGTNWMRPSFTAARALSASGFVLTNHCAEMSG